MVDLNNNEQIECKKLSRNLLISFLVAEKEFFRNWFAPPLHVKPNAEAEKLESSKK